MENPAQALEHDWHSVGGSNFHFQFTPKYRRKVFRDEHLRECCKELAYQKAAELGIVIEAMEYGPDHVHLFISMPPQISVSKIAQLIKGKTSRKLLIENPKLNKQFWGRHFWSRGYFATTSGAITDEMIMQYIKNQDDDLEKRGDEFTILDLE